MSTEDVVITKSMITRAKKAGACDEALIWLRQKPRTVDEVIETKLHFARWAFEFPSFARLLTPKQFDLLVRCFPSISIRRHKKKLSADQFNRCIKATPVTALSYARNMLTSEQLSFCVRRATLDAMCVCFSRLPEQLRTYCVRRYPYQSLLLESVRDTLTPKQLSFVIKKEPGPALRLIRNKLTPKQIEYCEQRS
jgi:hypothetical protein